MREVIRTVYSFDELTDEAKDRAVEITAGELIDRGLWGPACEILGINEWAVNEGQIDRDDEINMYDLQAVRIGLVGQLKSKMEEES